MKKNLMVIHDFTSALAAKQFAIALIENGVQFAYCPHPMSISHPPLAELMQDPQIVSGD